MRKEIRISGFGGQGVVLAGYILGKGLAIYDGFEAVMTQSYGPEARGGASSANVVLSDEPIDYPFVQERITIFQTIRQYKRIMKKLFEPGPDIFVSTRTFHYSLIPPASGTC